VRGAAPARAGTAAPRPRRPPTEDGPVGPDGMRAVRAGGTVPRPRGRQVSTRPGRHGAASARGQVSHARRRPRRARPDGDPLAQAAGARLLPAGRRLMAQPAGAGSRGGTVPHPRGRKASTRPGGKGRARPRQAARPRRWPDARPLGRQLMIDDPGRQTARGDSTGHQDVRAIRTRRPPGRASHQDARAVRMRGPSSVIATVCSTWAAREPSSVRRVQPSGAAW